MTDWINFATKKSFEKITLLHINVTVVVVVVVVVLMAIFLRSELKKLHNLVFALVLLLLLLL